MSINGNGSKPPIPFGVPSAQIPIIGERFALEGWFVTLILTCRCERPAVVMLAGMPGSAAGQCKSCGKIYALQGIGVDASGKPQFQLGMGHAPPAPEPQNQEP